MGHSDSGQSSETRCGCAPELIFCNPLPQVFKSPNRREGVLCEPKSWTGHSFFLLHALISPFLAYLQSVWNYPKTTSLWPYTQWSVTNTTPQGAIKTILLSFKELLLNCKLSHKLEDIHLCSFLPLCLLWVLFRPWPVKHTEGPQQNSQGCWLCGCIQIICRNYKEVLSWNALFINSYVQLCLLLWSTRLGQCMHIDKKMPFIN